MNFVEEFKRQQHIEEPIQKSITDTKQRTQQPMITGTSVLGIKFEGGVMLAADTLGSYGSMARFRSLSRLAKVGDTTAIGGSGDMSDFQYISNNLQELVDKDYCFDDQAKLYPSEIYNYMIRMMYQRRGKFDPLWNSIVVGGFQDNKPFLGVVDLVGSHYEDDTIATGYGAYIAIPLLRKHYETKNGKISEEEAKKILEESMRVLFYRDARTINKLQIATIKKDGVSITEPYSLETVWQYKNFK